MKYITIENNSKPECAHLKSEHPVSDFLWMVSVEFLIYFISRGPLTLVGTDKINVLNIDLESATIATHSLFVVF